MKCPEELQFSLYADGELNEGEARSLGRHLETCAACAHRAASYRTESEVLRGVLETWPEPARPGRATMAACVGGLAALSWLAGLGWSTSQASLPNWLNPFSLEGAINLLFNGGAFLARAGGILMTTVEPWSRAVGAASFLMLSLWGLGAASRTRPAAIGRGVLLLLTLMVGIAGPTARPAAAIEFRSGQQVSVDENETLDETLFATGEVVRVDGVVNGDLVAFAQRVIVNGSVTGSVLGGAQYVDIRGEVQGSAAGFGQEVRIGAAVSGSLYACGQTVSLLEGGAVGRDGFIAGELLEAAGTFGRDLQAAGRRLTVSGRVERDLEVEAEELRITPSGHVAGSIDAKLPNEERLIVAEGGFIGGDTNIQRPVPAARESRYKKSGFYVWGLIKLAGAFVVGAIALWLAPGLFGGRFGSAGAGFGRAGIGFVVLVATPVALVIAALTLVGLPLALVGAALFFVAVALSKIFVADWLGRRVTGFDGSRPKVFVALLVGLVILTVAGAIPWVGGWVKFAVLILGLGMLTLRIWQAGASRAAA